MTQIPFDPNAGSTLTPPGLRAWLHEKLAGMTRRPLGDKPTGYTDAEIRKLCDRNRGKLPNATDAMTQHMLRTGFLGHY